MTHPTGLPSQRTTQAVLREINRMRAQYDLPPVQAILKGRLNSGARSCNCPVAQTLNLGSDRRFYVGDSCFRRFYVGDSCWGELYITEHKIPPTVRRFVAALDAGRYPGLWETP